ncbi:MAG: hypothetical protein RL220_1070 [Bacteroidota bacterium]|jgi:hypothetical protein
MKLTLSTLLFLCIPVLMGAQDLKVLDYAPQFAKEKISERRCHVISYKGNSPTDTMLLTIEKFDQSGRVTECTEYMRGQRQKSHYLYSYDKSGRISGSQVEFYSLPGENVELVCSYDSRGKLISRKPARTIPGFWIEESYVYNASGVIVETKQAYDSGGKAVILPLSAYPQTLKALDNSLTYIYDQHQLLILHRLFNERGEMHQVKSYSFVRN